MAFFMAPLFLGGGVYFLVSCRVVSFFFVSFCSFHFARKFLDSMAFFMAPLFLGGGVLFFFVSFRFVHFV